MTRGLRLVAALMVVAATLVAAPATVQAARPDLSMVIDARYDVHPDERLVRVVLDIRLTNHLKDTTTTRYFFDEAYLAVQPDVERLRASWEGAGSPRIAATKQAADHTLLRLDFAQRLYGGKSADYRVTFDMVDPGGEATRDLRIGQTLASFPVWAFGTEDTPGGSVAVVFPAGFEVDVEAGSIAVPVVEDDGRVVFRTGELAAPLDFFTYLVADRPAAYTERSVLTALPTMDGSEVEVLIRHWPDDEPWAERVTGLIERGLPSLARHIGLPWAYNDEPLVVEEAVSRSTEGYAGLFDPDDGLVEIAYYADDIVVLHEAAHGWFNGALLADRWANEAFASYYAAEAAADLALEVTDPVLDETLMASRIPLNAWGPVGSAEVAAEDFAYAASLALARAIAERTSDDVLAEVWSDAANRVGAYQPSWLTGTAPREPVAGPPDWRGLLDLLEERADARFDDLWRTWVARASDLELLDARRDARAAYEEVVTEAGRWRLPIGVRDALRAWQFHDAERLLGDAAAVLTLRTQVDVAAEAADLVAPDSIRAAFEDADGFEDAALEAAAVLDTIHRIEAATALRPMEDSPMLTLGLWGETPDADLDSAAAALAAGYHDAARAAADEAARSWSSAETIGTTRAASIGALIAAFVLGVTIAVVAVRGRLRGRGAHAARLAD
jgi:hypothetical protein